MLNTCVVTHNRLDYTKMTIESYLATVQVPHYLVVVDNCSTDGTTDYVMSLAGDVHAFVKNDENLFPGKACNQGWKAAYSQHPEFPFMHRSDNDVRYLPGWDARAIEILDAWPEVGQLGLLLVSGIEFDLPETRGDLRVYKHRSGNVGGNQILRTSLYEVGVKYPSWKWGEGPGDDYMLSKYVRRKGGEIALMADELLECMSYDQWIRYPEYDRWTAQLRGVEKNWRGERPEPLR